MEIADSGAGGRQFIEGYGGGSIRVGGALHRGPVLVFADRTVAWQVADMTEISLESLAAVERADPPVEVLLLGCGVRATPVPADLRQALRAAGVVIEAMDTGAACRTFNLLISEERRAAAALIPVD